MNHLLKHAPAALLSLLLTVAPFAGHAQTTTQSTTPVAKASLQVGQKYYITSDGLNIRSSNSTTDKNVVGKLSLNDVVEVYNLLNAATPLVQVKIVTSISVKPDVAPELFVSKDYLSATAVNATAATGASKYFVVQNIATEKTRVYERCTTTPDCPHTLVIETDMVVGRPEEGTDTDRYAYITWLGHSKIQEWVKFYTDGAGEYPPWYTAGQDVKTIPTPITDSVSNLLGARKWTVTNKHGDETMYGAFGWYAAKLSPQDESGVNHQWMHGTIGWGKDQDAAIEVTRSALLNIFTNPGSHGCTRLENRSIAFLRTILPPGTDIYRVYARESTREEEKVSGLFHKTVTPLPRYADKYEHPGHWDYILLTNGAQQSNGLTADAAAVRASGIAMITGQNLLEQGTFEYNQYPSAVQPDYNQMASSGLSGDRYQIDSGRPNDVTHFHGYFLVDEGRFVDYQHPNPSEIENKVHISGLADFRNSVPSYLATTGTHHPPQINYHRDNNNNHNSGGN